jgi:hypothetical protein
MNTQRATFALSLATLCLVVVLLVIVLRRESQNTSAAASPELSDSEPTGIPKHLVRLPQNSPSASHFTPTSPISSEGIPQPGDPVIAPPPARPGTQTEPPVVPQQNRQVVVFPRRATIMESSMVGERQSRRSLRRRSAQRHAFHSVFRMLSSMRTEHAMSCVFKRRLKA